MSKREKELTALLLEAYDFIHSGAATFTNSKRIELLDKIKKGLKR